MERSYPPDNPGLPALDVAEIIAAHADLVRRLRYAHGAEPGIFDRDIGSVIERYAQHVHLLPATADRHFRRAGGLFRLGLEIGFYALQGTDGAIFPGGRTLTARSILEPRWRYATFLAGLCSELYRTLGQLTVTNDRGDTWPAYLHPLARWLADTQTRHYQLHWLPRPEENRALGVVAMSRIVTPAIMQYLAEGNSMVLPHLMASVSGTAGSGEANTLDQLVRRSAALVIERNRRADMDAVPEAPCATAFTPQPRFEPHESSAPRQASRALPVLECAPEEHEAADLPQAPATPVAVRARARLHPAVRAALRQIIATLEGPASHQAVDRIAPGGFVALREFERRGVDPALAVRALSDAGLLACDPGEPHSRTCARTVAGETVLGVILAPECISAPDELALGATGGRDGTAS